MMPEGGLWRTGEVEADSAQDFQGRVYDMVEFIRLPARDKWGGATDRRSDPRARVRKPEEVDDSRAVRERRARKPT